MQRTLKQGGIFHFVHCDVEHGTVVGIMGPGLRFHPSLTHCCRQLRSFSELSSAPLLWLQIHFFSYTDCFDMEKKLQSGRSLCFKRPFLLRDNSLHLDLFQNVPTPPTHMHFEQPSQPSQSSPTIRMSTEDIVWNYTHPTISNLKPRPNT